MAFVAGVRDNNVGTDVEFYALGTWQTLKNHMGDFIEANEHVRREGLYSLVSYTAAMLSDKFGLALFFIQLFISVFVVHALKRYMHIVPLWLSMLVFNLYYYCFLLTMLAQGMACAFFLWSLRFFEDRKFIPLMICAVICFFLHNSSAVAYAALLPFWVFEGTPEPVQKRLLVVVVIVGVAALLAYLSLLEYITTIIPALEQLGNYGTQTFKPSVSTVDVLIRMVIIGYSLVMAKLGKLQSKLVYYAMPFFLADFFSQLLGMYNYHAVRIGHYFFVYAIVLFLLAVMRTKMTKGTMTIVGLCTVCLMVYYCVRFYFIKGIGETYPYSSEFLGL